MNVTALCEVFCDALVITEVPVGFAVKTGFQIDGGDALVFFLVAHKENDMWRIEDDGATVANLDMDGVDVMASGPEIGCVCRIASRT